MLLAAATVAGEPDPQPWLSPSEEQSVPDGGPLSDPPPPPPVQQQLKEGSQPIEPSVPLKRSTARLGVSADVLSDGKSVAATGRAFGTIYLKRLVDLPDVPLALQPFVEHPSQLTLTAEKIFSGWAAEAGADVFLFENTALSGSIGGKYLPSVPLVNSETGGVTGSAGVVHYFDANVGAGLAYIANRFYASVYSATDGARATLSVFARQFLIQTQLDVWRVSNGSFGFAPRLDAFFSVNRRLGISSRFSGSWLTLPNLPVAGASVTLGSETIGLGVDFYVTDSLDLTGGWTVSLHQIPSPLRIGFGTPFDQVAPLVHDFSLGAAIRL